MKEKIKKTSAKIYLFCGFIICFCICACVKEQNGQAILLMIKNQNIKLNNTGFLYNNSLQAFELTKEILNLKINENQICLNKKCYAKYDFNKHFFGAAFYDDLLEDLINLRPIFYSKNIKKDKNFNCFTQEINDAKTNIFYKKCDNFIIFKDKNHSNFIKMKFLN